MVLPELPTLWPKMHRDNVSELDKKIKKEPKETATSNTAADTNKKILDLMIKGLIETIRIVTANFTKIAEENKKNVGNAINKANEFLQSLDRSEGREQEPQPQVPEEIKHTKKEVETLISLFKQQLDAIKAIEKLIQIEVKIDADIENKIKKLKIATDAKTAIEILESMKKDVKLEERLMEGREYRQLKKLLTEERQILNSYEKLRLLAEVLFQKAKEYYRDDVFFRLAADIKGVIEKMEEYIKRDETSKLRVIIAAVDKLMGPNGEENHLLKAIESGKKVIEERTSPSKTYELAFAQLTADAIEKMVKIVNENMKTIVQSIKSFEDDIRIIISRLSEIIYLLEQAKKLAKE